MPGTELSGWHAFFNWIFETISYIILMLQVNKLRHLEVEKSAEG